MKNLVVLFLFLAGCATFPDQVREWNSRAADKKEFQVTKRWVRSTTQKDNLGFRKINRMTAALAGSLIIQSNGLDGVVAFNRETGAQVWRLSIPNGAEGNAALIRDRLFLGASDGNFYAIETSTGQILWAFQTNSEILSEPLLEEGIVYFLSGNNVVYALDASTGKQVWLYSRQDTSSFSIRGGSKPAYHNGNLYLGFSDGSLVALQAKNGAIVWEVQLNRNKKFRDVDASPVVDGDRLYIPSYDDKLYCIALSHGEVLWRVDGGGYSAVTLVDDKIVYPTTTGEVRVLKRSNGDRFWTYKLKQGIATQVKSLKGLLVFGESQGRLMFLESTSGRVLNGFDPGRGILASPLIDEKRNEVYFISGEANIYALEAKWGRPDWYTSGNKRLEEGSL